MTRYNALSHEAGTSGQDADCFTVQCGLMIYLVYMFRQYGKDYIALEDAAHQAHKGMWQGSFEMPADWRKDQKIDKLLAQRGRSLQPQGEYFHHCSMLSATALTLCSHGVIMQTNSFLLSCAHVMTSTTVVACICYDQSIKSCAADAASNAALPQIASSTSLSSSQDGPANGCKIKGNINSKGEKIYHVPGGRYYDSTQIDLPQGERWFCTERQAKDAGWRAAQ